MRIALVAAVVLGSAVASLGACPGSCAVQGGGPKRHDCLVEFDGVPSARVRCTDGDPSCDTDGSVNGGCRFVITTCLDVADERLKCGPSEITSFQVRNGRAGTRRFDPALAALAARVSATPLPTSTTTCHADSPVYVTLRGRKRFHPTTLRLRATARTSDGRRDADMLALTCVPSALQPSASAGYARAHTIADAAELIDGPLARGRLGDVRLANDRLQVIIQQPERSMFGIGTYGGNIIDADRQRPRGEERDNFEEMIPQINVENTANYTAVTVLADGSDGGPAIVRATGPDDLFDFVNASSVVEQAGFMFPPSADDRDLPVEVQTDYVLEPGADWVRIETTITNLDPSPLDIFLGDYLNGSGQVELFQPGYGFGEPLVTTPCPPSTWVPCAAGTCDPCNFVAYAGEDEAAGVSYGYVHTANGSSTFSVSGVTATLLGNEVLFVLIGIGTPNFHLDAAGAPGDALTVTRYFVVGDGSVAAIASARDTIQGIVTGTIAGRVTSDGEPLADADVAVIGDTPPARPSINVIDHFRTDAAGRYRGTLAPGQYTVRANKEGRPFGDPDPATVVIEADDEIEQDFELPPPGFLEVGVTDADGGPLTAKVQLVGFDPSPNPASTQDIAGAVFNRTGVFGDLDQDGLPFGLTGVWFADKTGSIGRVDVEPGTYRVYVSRGPRYSLFSQDVTIAAGTTTTVAARLARVVDTPGFIAGDFHIHAIDSPDSEVTRTERVATQLAEGIDFFTPSEHDIRVDFAPTIAAMGVGDLIATAPSAEITTFDYGHFNSWPVTVDPSQTNGGSVDWGRAGIAPGMDFPSLGSFGLTPGEIYDAAHADPRPNLIQINHIDSFFNTTGLDIDTAENDTGPPTSHATAASRRLDPSVPNFFDDGFDALEVWNGSQRIFLGESIGDWFNMLNYGILRTAVADSDTHERRTNGGAVRTWVASAVSAPKDLPAEADALAASIVAGHAIGTNSVFFTPRLQAPSTGETAGLGPNDATMLRTTDGHVSLTIDVRAPLWAEFDRIEIYRNHATERWDHDGNPSTRLRYRVTPSFALDAGTDFTITQFDDEPSIPGAGHRETNVTLELLNLVEDSWFVVLVRGTPGVSRPLFPVLPGISPAGNTTLADLVDGNLGEGGETVLAFSNPLYVDVDGNGFTAPGVRVTEP
jgi:hypothetical protein